MTDLVRLRGEIQRMTRKSRLYRLLKQELMSLGYWRNRARGDASKGGRIRKHGKKIGEWEC